MCCNTSLDEEGQALVAIFFLLIPAALYILGLGEGKKSRRFFFAGLFLHSLSILQRGLTLGMIPLTEKHDNISFTALCMALIYWRFSMKRGARDLAQYALPLISLVLLVAVTYAPINTISPFQRSPWFFLHMFFHFVSYAMFGISSCIGLLYVINGDSESEALQYQGAAYGWIMFSIALVAGSIWFFTAYGTYWLWTSKELWITLTWFYYGAYLHARYIKGFSRIGTVVMGILGFGVALFTYFGVGTVIPSPPTQF